MTTTLNQLGSVQRNIASAITMNPFHVYFPGVTLLSPFGQDLNNPEPPTL
jgi:hypothetical protein